MNKIKLAKFIFAASAFSSAVHAAEICKAAMPEVRNMFSDLDGNFSKEAKVEFSLLQDCARNHRICVVVKTGEEDSFQVIKGQDPSDFDSLNNRSSIAVSAIVDMSTSRGDRCVLGRYSGGSSANWMLISWGVQKGKLKFFRDPALNLVGESKAPSTLVNELRIAGRGLH